jgi:hypothetical protein
MSNVRCETFTFGNTPCEQQYYDPCYGAHHKGNLRPIKITDSTARLKFKVPRQSVFSRPYETGWTLLITRAGSRNTTASYGIENYDGQTEQATFFIDDVLRRAPKGYYQGTVMRGCCKVATALFYVVCDEATAIEAEDFTHDPAPACTAGEEPRPAESCEPPCSVSTPVLDKCSTKSPCHAN